MIEGAKNRIVTGFDILGIAQPLTHTGETVKKPGEKEHGPKKRCGWVDGSLGRSALSQWALSGRLPT